jgi:hypothetical protein
MRRGLFSGVKLKVRIFFSTPEEIPLMPSYAITAGAIEHYLDAVVELEDLLSRLSGEESRQITHGELEALVQAQGSELLRRLIQGHLDQRSAEEPLGERVVGGAGVARTHRREGCQRLLETRFGEVIVNRRGLWGGWTVFFPLDAQLSLPPDKYSQGLREVLVEEVVRGSFDEAVDHFARVGGGQMAKRQAEEAAVHLSQDFDAFSAQPLGPPQAGADEGKGIVMRPDSLREATRNAMKREAHKQHTRLSPGEKKNRKRMATVVSVYEVGPYPRTAEQILHPAQQPEGKRPRPERKTHLGPRGDRSGDGDRAGFRGGGAP